MNKQFTPGPWEVDGHSINAENGSACNIAICDHAYVPRGWSGSDRTTNKHMLANAVLVAASPELLESLSDLLAMCERQEDFNDDGDGQMFDRARAAIAKATGAA